MHYKSFNDALCHRWLPVYVDKEQQLGVMSIGFLIGNKNDAVVWRGPKKNGKLKAIYEKRYPKILYLKF